MFMLHISVALFFSKALQELLVSYMTRSQVA